MGGTGAAVGEGFEATYLNPALLSRARSRELQIGWQAVSLSLYVDGPNAPGELSTEGLTGTFIGLTLPVPFGGVLERRVALGIGVFSPTARIARARVLYPERAQFPALPDRLQTLSFNAGAGVDLGYGLRVGAGALLLAEMVGTVVVANEATGSVGTQVDSQLVATYAPNIGASFESGDYIVGLDWRGELEGNFDVQVEVRDLGQLVVPNLDIAGVAQYDPMQAQLELARRSGSLELAVGVTYKRWSDFGGWARPTVTCPEEHPGCAALIPPSVDLSDTWVPRVGGAYGLPLGPRARGTLRAGYFFEPSPLPEQTGRVNYLDNHRHAFTLGYGVQLLEPWPRLRVDTFYQLHWLQAREHVKGTDVEPENEGAPMVQAGGWLHNFGLVAGVRF